MENCIFSFNFLMNTPSYMSKTQFDINLLEIIIFCLFVVFVGGRVEKLKKKVEAKLKIVISLCVYMCAACFRGSGKIYFYI